MRLRLVFLACLLSAAARAQDLERAQDASTAIIRNMAAVPGSRPARKDAVSFYFVGHEDDWQLFMNPPAFKDVAATEDPASPLREAVFVHLTAGDAGSGLDAGTGRAPYYKARENGARAAIRFMADAQPGRMPRAASRSMVALNGHRVFRVAYRRTAAYFLRLPDGDGSGNGYDSTGHQSLRRLEDGDIRTMTAIDGSATYRGWPDLVATLRTLIDRERAGSPRVSLNVSDPDPAVNPGDHPDHRAASQAALEAAAELSCARRVLHQTYHVADLPPNLGPEEDEMQAGVFAVTAAGVTALGSPNTWEPHYKAWLGRGYSRVEEPAETCR